MFYMYVIEYCTVVLFTYGVLSLHNFIVHVLDIYA